ncbi:PHB depolymerase family esterase [Sphingomonas sp. LY29]|uniref:extracellular catalytic domain type 1 short-chain-length polyhydroxyalkanoate depolymerase n=1 Tax=Sphingomonas sp. LY29 TaxID=3095341 RepID=UPI002D778B1B|nr:PHB depolymerase family esterase [Sphingomonas sp. LY29]WRP25076.1 PHB depolymerase family esterase [Sphingomonas sp. LY29]
MTATRRAFQAAMTEDEGRLAPLGDFAPNPGALDALCHVPEGLAEGAPLVVILHGCTQNAAVYDRGSGWSALADRHGFALLYPQQRRANNSNLCFNWYSPADARRDRGEAKSIAAMIAHMIKTHGLDPSRVFVTGLSAGGAMTAVMLASYPELFAGGAIIAGLPFASANTLPAALERMRGEGSPSRHELAARAGEASAQKGPHPTLSVWHGTHDGIVDIANAGVIVDQWRDLHGIGKVDGDVETIGRHRRETWRDAKGRALVERIDVAGMGHGTPIDTRGEESVGRAAPHMLESGICSTTAIAERWGITVPRKAQRVPKPITVDAVPAPSPTFMPSHNAIGAVIEDALRTAGLMR